MEISTDAGTKALSAANQLRLEGLEEGKKEIIKKMLLSKNLSIEEIVQYTSANLKFIQEVQKELGLV